jgi:hypothetical protein
MLAGAGLARTLSVLGVAARHSSITALVIGGVVAIFSVTAGGQTFSVVMLFMSLVLLPNASLARAGDCILPGSSALEVVCFNVLAIAIGGPSPTFPIFDVLFGERRVFCAQMTADVRGLDGLVRPELMLLVYVPGAPDGSQYAWLYEPKAACARVVEVVRPSASRIGPGFGYLWDPETASARQGKMAWLGQLEDTSPPPAR